MTDSLDVSNKNISPKIIWSHKKITLLTEKFKKLDENNIEKLILKVILKYVDGNYIDAEKDLKILFHNIKEEKIKSEPLIKNLLFAAFVCQNFDIVSEIFSSKYNVNCSLKFNISPKTFGENRIYITFNLPESIEFTLDPHIYMTDKTDVQVLWIDWIFPVFANYAQYWPGDNGKILFSNSDDAYGPGLSMCSNRPDCFLIPDNVYLPSLGYHQAKIEADKFLLPWTERVAIAFWRGSTTGQPTDRKRGWHSLPRIRLCEIGREFPDIIDAGISSVIQIEDPNAELEIINAGLKKSFIPAIEFNKFKYQIDIDGNTNAWSGLFQKLLSGNPVLKVSSDRDFKQWYYDRLIPWINYIPVKKDMSDLIEKIYWLRSNDDKAFQIGARGRELALSMNIKNELERSNNVISAALKYFSGNEEKNYNFKNNVLSNEITISGFEFYESKGLITTNRKSEISFLRPIAEDNFDLIIDLEPYDIKNQIEFVIIVNNCLKHSSILSKKESITLRISKELNKLSSKLELLILTPFAKMAASEDAPLDERYLGITVHSLKLCAQSILKNHDSDLRHFHRYTFGPLPEHSDDLQKGSLWDHNGMVIYADIETGILRIKKDNNVQSNIQIYLSEKVAYLVMSTKSGKKLTICPKNQYDTYQSNENLLHEIGISDVIQEFISIKSINNRISLQKNSFFICSESSGEITLSRTNIGDWELFRLVS